MVRIVKINEIENFPHTVHTWTIDWKDGFLYVASSSLAFGGRSEYKFKCPNKNGELVLVNTTNEKAARFRSAEFSDWLEKHNLHSMVHEDPNGTHCCYNSNVGRKGSSALVDSDGEIEEVFGESYAKDNWGNASYSYTNGFLVRGATWLILESYGKRRLYSLLPYHKLKLD